MVTRAMRKVFSAVVLCPGLSVVEVAQLAGVHPDTAGQALPRLEADELVTRSWRVRRWAIYPAARVLA